MINPTYGVGLFSEINNQHSDSSDETDEDPFYEIYNCHHVTFLDNKIIHPTKKFEAVEFSKGEEVEDMIKS